MDDIVKAAEKISYSDSDIKNYLDNDVRILRYPDLSKFRSAEDILGGTSCACILYMTKHNYGHWTCLIKNPGNQQGIYEVFDPYGIRPDDELKFINDKFRSESNQDKKYLTNILMNDIKNGDIKDVLFNPYQLQKQMQDINTCGRWCAVRCAWKFLTNNEFCAIFLNQKLSPDSYVTLMTLANK